MKSEISLDLLVKARLKNWGQRPPGVRPGRGKDAWLRGRPSDDGHRISSPFLKMPGSRRLRTLPDGLWLNFGGTYAEPYVDILRHYVADTPKALRLVEMQMPRTS